MRPSSFNARITGQMLESSLKNCYEVEKSALKEIFEGKTVGELDLAALNVEYDLVPLLDEPLWRMVLPRLAESLTNLYGYVNLADSVFQRLCRDESIDKAYGTRFELISLEEEGRHILASLEKYMAQVPEHTEETLRIMRQIPHVSAGD